MASAKASSVLRAALLFSGDPSGLTRGVGAAGLANRCGGPRVPLTQDEDLLDNVLLYLAEVWNFDEYNNAPYGVCWSGGIPLCTPSFYPDRLIIESAARSSVLFCH
jgi:hypothetical protein